jgi:DNA replication protein DnaD
MNSIVKNWQSKGLRSADDILTGDAKPSRQTKNSEGTAPDKTELERMKKYLNTLKQS